MNGVDPAVTEFGLIPFGGSVPRYDPRFRLRLGGASNACGADNRHIKGNPIAPDMPVARMRFTGTGNGTHTIDLARALSLHERKLIRQKQLFTVYGGYFIDTPDGGTNSRVDLSTAPNTWPVRRAVNRGFALWRKVTSHVLKNTEGSTSGKYSDFKVYLDQKDSILLPVDAGGQNLKDSGNAIWDYSTLFTEDPFRHKDTNSSNPDGQNYEFGEHDSFELMIVGADHKGANGDWDRLSLLKSWVDSRAIPQESTPDLNPSTPNDPLSNLFDASDVDDNRLSIIDDESVHPPYDNDTMFGNAQNYNNAAFDYNLQRQTTAITSAANPIAPLHGFQAVCGLCRVQVVAEGTWELVIDVEIQGESF